MLETKTQGSVVNKLILAALVLILGCQVVIIAKLFDTPPPSTEATASAEVSVPVPEATPPTPVAVTTPPHPQAAPAPPPKPVAPPAGSVLPSRVEPPTPLARQTFRDPPRSVPAAPAPSAEPVASVVVVPPPLLFQALPNGCEMRIDGDSTAHKWHCIGNIIGGDFEVESAWQTDLSLQSVSCLGPGRVPPKCEITIPVRSLKSQVPVASTTMDDRMYAEMKAKPFPQIHYKLAEMTLKGEVPPTGSPVTFDTKGWLALAGVSNLVAFPVTMERLPDGILRFTGSYETRMTAFGIKPPQFTLMGAGLKTADPVTLTWTWLTRPATR